MYREVYRPSQKSRLTSDLPTCLTRILLLLREPPYSVIDKTGVVLAPDMDS